MLVSGHCMHCEPKKVAYTVRGSWPFPIDMLRHDQAVPATPQDKAEIERMSRDRADSREDFKPRDINLIGLYKPNTARWESFGWAVPADEQHATLKAMRQAQKKADDLFQSAIAKLSDEERKAVMSRVRM
jgi:hypothetical protein